FFPPDPRESQRLLPRAEPVWELEWGSVLALALASARELALGWGRLRREALRSFRLRHRHNLATPAQQQTRARRRACKRIGSCSLPRAAVAGWNRQRRRSCCTRKLSNRCSGRRELDSGVREDLAHPAATLLHQSQPVVHLHVPV